jgi:hypothetical protein
VFSDSGWQYQGTKDTLQHVIEKDTGIEGRGLDAGNLLDFSVAQKLSWAAARVTTRVEDVAYCLLGL